MSSFAYTTPFASNPLETREDLAKYLVGVLDPLAAHTSPGGSRIHLGFTGTHFDETAAHLEGFSRPIWGLASLLAGGGDYDGVQRWVNGLANGTNPDHEEFWGNMRDKDQRMVECSAIGFSLAVGKSRLWDPLPDEGKRSLENWLGGMNDKAMPNTNWLWFRVFANLGLSKVGSPRFDAQRMKADLDHLDTFYIGDGWSRDGPEGVIQLDYYSSSFAIQYAQLVYSKLAQEEDPVCIRFAMSSFWGAVAFADLELPEPLTWGVVKGLLLRNIRYWARQPGAYNSGSPYWCCKSFIPLSLPPSHPFWTAKEEAYPEALRETVKALYKPFHIATNIGGHMYILSSGQQCSYPVKQSAAKYGKFAYSSAFGYSVPVGSLTLEELGGDNTLALTDDEGETWKCRRETREARIENGRWLRSMWYPWNDVEVETWLVPPTKDAPLWHLRVHRIRTGRKLISAEGGFAIYGQGDDDRALEPATGEAFGTVESGKEARAASKAGVSGIAELGPAIIRTGKALRTDANTNLMVPRAVLPTLMGEHDAEAGQDIWLLTAVFGLPSINDEHGARPGWEEEWKKRPVVPEEIAVLIQ